MSGKAILARRRKRCGWKRKPPGATPSAKRKSNCRSSIAIAQLLALLAAGHVDAALKLYGKLLTADAHFQPTRDELRALIRGLHKQQKWSASAPFMAELADRFPEGSEPVRLKLAQICVVELNRPGRALDLLGELDVAKLTAEQTQLSRQIARKAESLQAAGTVELDDGGW